MAGMAGPKPCPIRTTDFDPGNGSSASPSKRSASSMAYVLRPTCWLSRESNESPRPGAIGTGFRNMISLASTVRTRSRSPVKSSQILRWESKDRTATRSFGVSPTSSRSLSWSIRSNPIRRSRSRLFCTTKTISRGGTAGSALGMPARSVDGMGPLLGTAPPIHCADSTRTCWPPMRTSKSSGSRPRIGRPVPSTTRASIRTRATSTRSTRCGCWASSPTAAKSTSTVAGATALYFNPTRRTTIPVHSRSTIASYAMIRNRSWMSDPDGKICVIRIPISSSVGSTQNVVLKKPLQ